MVSFGDFINEIRHERTLSLTKSYPNVGVMKSAEFRCRCDGATAMHRPGPRRILVQTKMGPPFVVQLGDGTPIGPSSASFFIDGILGRVGTSTFMK
jgi:hypothetical protein